MSRPGSKQMSGSMYVHCHRVFAAGRKARDRAVAEESANRNLWPLDAAAAIILAAASAEAFINEFAEVNQNPKGDPLLRACSDALAEVESAHGSLRLKYLIASQMLSGAMFDKGSPPYQDFDILVQLRNDLMHLKPRDKFVYSEQGLESMTVPKHIQALQQRGLARTLGPNVGISWFDCLLTGESQVGVRYGACNYLGDLGDGPRRIRYAF